MNSLDLNLLGMTCATPGGSFFGLRVCWQRKSCGLSPR
ncbi:hypothetical protein IWX85_001104 [Polaromonas sp. CG_9.11]|nr:hypothetical protein [Polaromonas sp. CG_9.11]